MIASAPYYWLVCECCGENSQEQGEYSAWSDEDSAVENAKEYDWRVDGESHFCSDCVATMECHECGEDNGSRPGERRPGLEEPTYRQLLAERRLCVECCWSGC